MSDRTRLQDLPLFNTAPTTASPTSSAAGDSKARLAQLNNWRRPTRTGGEPTAAPTLTAVPTTRATDPTAVPATRATEVGQWHEPIDWTLVTQYRTEASQLLADRLRAWQNENPHADISDADRRELGRSIVGRLLVERSQDLAATGGEQLTPQAEQALVEQILDSMFGLGRLQPLLNDPTIEDIEITGDRVVTLHDDGRITQAAPVANSDSDLVNYISFLKSRDTHAGERPWSPAQPELRLALPGRARLTALNWVTPRPVIRIRIHRHVDVTLEDTVRMGMTDHVIAAFLGAAVRAKRSIMLSGPQGGGKTTLLRACGRAIPARESIGFLEAERELYLDEVGHWIRPPVPIEARPGSGETGVNGRPAGELTTGDLFPALLRLNLNRVLVGEVRTPQEMLALFEALRAGSGTLSTIHSKSAGDTIERMAGLLHATGFTQESAYQQVAQHVDLIVHLESRWDPTTERRYRYVTEIIEVRAGEQAHTGLQVESIFAPGYDGRAVPAQAPTFINDLVTEGFDRADLDAGRSNWTTGMEDLR